ncbi:MAG: hypothetical protein JWO33_2351 [Caulobacteraceae bacterium]|nr:hypothetical protein [Caulobacteraceae bacterium]
MSRIATGVRFHLVPTRADARGAIRRACFGEG